MRDADGFLFRLCPADGDLRVLRLLLPALGVESLDHWSFSSSGDESIRGACGEFRHLVSACGNVDWRTLFGKREETCILHREIQTTMALIAALPECAKDTHGFLEHLLANSGGRPLLTNHMLV